MQEKETKTGFEAEVVIALREHNRRNLKPKKSVNVISI
jgi:hypothetical protein